MFSASIKVKDKTKNIINNLEKSYQIAMENLMKTAKEIALRNKHGSKDEDSILFEITVTKDSITGRLYTNFDYAMFLEYGTGTEAEMPHIGHTETFINSGYRYWFLPKEVADAKGKEFNPQRLINIKGKLFYIMFSTKPFPFMRPTAFELEDKAAKMFAESIVEQIGK